ncbi:MAG: hypothetical protein NXI25_25770, partial [bacterium]|nr:hypothetical protein [bacterium]
MAKVCGPVQDYGLNYELIQFQFDRWVTGYFTARGAVGADTPLKWLLRRFPDAPQQNYATKLHVVDLHRQYGAAALFLTVAPGLFEAPLPAVVEQPMLQGRVTVLGCNALACLHISHLLEELCTAYVLHRDQRSLRSPYGLLRCNKAENPILAAVVKYEYQDGARQAREDYHGTGVKHAHILVWLRDPHRNCFLQWMCSTSDGHPAWLQTALRTLQKQPTRTPLGAYVGGVDSPEWHGGALRLEGEGSARLCLSTLAASYLAHTDVTVVVRPGQASDYMAKVCAYTAKDVSGLDHTWLEQCSSSLTAARLYLRSCRPSVMKQLDMLREASNWKCTVARKEVWLPLPTDAADDPLVRKYMACPVRPETMTYLQWLRGFRTENVTKPRPYASEDHGVSLAVFYASRTKDAYYGQWLVANVAFRKEADLQTQAADRVPA